MFLGLTFDIQNTSFRNILPVFFLTTQCGINCWKLRDILEMLFGNNIYILKLSFGTQPPPLDLVFMKTEAEID